MKTENWENMLRQAMKNSGLSRYEIAKQSGVAAAVLCRFVSGKRTITLPTAEKIAKVVGLELKKRDEQ